MTRLSHEDWLDAHPWWSSAPVVLMFRTLSWSAVRPSRPRKKVPRDPPRPYRPRRVSQFPSGGQGSAGELHPGVQPRLLHIDADVAETVRVAVLDDALVDECRHDD